MIFRTKGLKVSRLLAIPIFCFVLIALLHPDTGYCGKQKDQPKDKIPLLGDQDSGEDVVDVVQPPPYSPAAGASAEAFSGRYLETDDARYFVHDTRKVAPVSMQALDRGNQYLDISYNDLVPENYDAGDYITTPVKFSIYNHHLKEQIQFTGTLWLFPNGVGSGAKHGRVLVTLQGLRKNILPNGKPFLGISRALLKATDTDNSIFRLVVTKQHSTTDKSESFIFPLTECERTLIDIGCSFRMKQFKDQFNQHTIRLSLPPCSQLRRDNSIAPGHGHSFVFEIPYDALLHERREDGKPTPQAKVSRGNSTGWIEIDGHFISFALQNKTPFLTTYIYAPADYSELQELEGYYPSRDADTSLSSSQKKVMENKAAWDSKLYLFSFIKNRELSIYWKAPDGNNHQIGLFGKSRHRSREVIGKSRTVPWKSPITYKRFFEKLDGRNAIFRIVVSAPASDQDLASHSGKYIKLASDDSDGSNKGSVQPAQPPVADFHQLQINGGKVGTSAGKSQ